MSYKIDYNSMSIVIHNISLLICVYMGVELFGLEIPFTSVYVDALYMKEINVTHTLITFSNVDDIWFSLNGRTYKNNSLVTLDDIGENDTALLCMTNLSDCCQSPYAGSVMSDWWFPNGTAVPSANLSETSDLNWEFYSDRGQMVVRMYRRRGGVSGIYRCEIPDSVNVTQTIYIGVYTASSGE